MIILVAVSLFLGLVLAIFFVSQRRMFEELKAADESIKKEIQNNQGLVLLQQQLGQLVTQINQQLQSISTSVTSRLDKVDETVNKVHKGLGEASEATKRILEVGKDVASLQDILRAPKFRGGLGEFLLENLLSQILPPRFYELQYTFRNGERVDAVIFLGEGKVPVDSKFPLESFKRVIASQTDEERKKIRREFEKDVKKHIDDISAKYIREEEGTYNFALMYIPAENVYYETIIKDEELGEEKSLFSYALKKRVIPVSPNSFYAYLQSIALGLRGLSIEERAREILGQLAQVEKGFKNFREDFSTLGTHLERAKNKYDETEKKLARLEGQMASAAQLSNEQEGLPSS
jgi:DNA recombination protein RmuC